MASIGQLVRAVAQVSGLEEASVKLIARYLREAGLITQQSTGGGAARMTPGDGAALLIAVNASLLAKDAAESVRRYSNLFGYFRFSPETKEDDLLGLNAELDELESFGEVLTRIIELSMPTPAGLAVLSYGPRSALVQITIKFELPNPSVSLFVREAGATKDVAGPNISTIFFQEERESREIDGDECDRKVEVTITNATIYSVAQTLAQ